MPKVAAGIVLYRRRRGELELLLGHLGGPYYARRDAHAWTVPKGLVEEGEDYLAAARREWTEETGAPPPGGDYVALPVIRRSGKHDHLFLVEGDLEAGDLRSDTCRVEWPPRSGQWVEVPEVDRWAWVRLAEAEEKLTKRLGSVPGAVVGELRSLRR